MSRANFSKIAEQIEKDGFDRGYRQAVKDMRRALGSSLDRLVKSDQEAESHESQGSLLLTNADVQHAIRHAASATKVSGSSGQKMSAEDRVFETIRAIPGLRGAMIVKALADTGEAVKERTVRTALWRLKTRKIIEQRGNEWYVTAYGKDWYAVE